MIPPLLPAHSWNVRSAVDAPERALVNEPGPGLQPGAMNTKATPADLDTTPAHSTACTRAFTHSPARPTGTGHDHITASTTHPAAMARNVIIVATVPTGTLFELRPIRNRPALRPHWPTDLLSTSAPSRKGARR